MNFFQKWVIGQPGENYSATSVTVVEKKEELAIEQTKVVATVVVAQPATPPPAPLLPSPPSTVLSPDRLVRPFGVRSIEHAVTLEGNQYNVVVSNFNWLSSGQSTHAKVTISLPGRWAVTSRGNLMLTWKGGPIDGTDEMIGAFAQAGYQVERRLIDACLFPIQNQILEIERQLKGF